MKAIINMNVSKLVGDDLILFGALFKDIFPNWDTPK